MVSEAVPHMELGYASRCTEQALCSARTAGGPSTDQVSWLGPQLHTRDCQRCSVWFKADKDICLLLLPSMDDTSKLAPNTALVQLNAVQLHGEFGLVCCEASELEFPLPQRLTLELVEDMSSSHFT